MKCKVADDKKPHLFIQKAIFNFAFGFFSNWIRVDLHIVRMLSGAHFELPRIA